MIEQLKKILFLIEEELEDENSIWTKDQLNGIVKPEMEELLFHFAKGTKFFKYGKKQRMLSSTYLLTDCLLPLTRTRLGEEIRKLQEIYDRV